MGGGGGGEAVVDSRFGGSKLPGMGGGGNGEVGTPILGVGGPGLEGLSIDLLSSIADKGRGGAMLPKSIDANCLALPPVGFSGPSSSSDEEVESTTDHSSSSGRTREGRWPVGVEARGGGCGCDLVASCCWARRWKGFVDSVGGEVTDEGGTAGSEG